MEGGESQKRMYENDVYKRRGVSIMDRSSDKFNTVKYTKSKT
jgi:hypothetical protein